MNSGRFMVVLGLLACLAAGCGSVPDATFPEKTQLVYALVEGKVEMKTVVSVSSLPESKFKVDVEFKGAEKPFKPKTYELDVKAQHEGSYITLPLGKVPFWAPPESLADQDDLEYQLAGPKYTEDLEYVDESTVRGRKCAHYKHVDEHGNEREAHFDLETGFMLQGLYKARNSKSELEIFSSTVEALKLAE